jgi:NitT/TauT family transport system substrate-binding protein
VKTLKLLAAALALAAMSVAAPAQTMKVRLAVGGKPSLFYLPLTVAERLGYFKDAGLDVEISDFPGGAKALQALVGGSADVVTGAYDHIVQMRAQNQPVIGLVEIGRFPGYALAIVTAKAASYTGPKDLKGMKIGVTAPGSSTHFMVKHLMAQNGVSPDDAAYIGVGASATAVAAVRRGEIDALVNTDPVISLLENERLIKVVADTRTPEGTRRVYGGLYTAAVLYTQPQFIDKSPRAAQALANAFVRALKWVKTHSPEEIANAMPEDYAIGNKALYVQSIRNSVPAYSPDGRFGREGAETAYKVLAEFDPAVHAAKFDVTTTYDARFVEKANAGQ